MVLPLPFPTTRLSSLPRGRPAPSSSERPSDWLRIVFIHEFTHVVHLDRSVGWAKVVRGIFGRVPLAFPNLFLPKWQIEGLATYEESVMTDGGRLHAGDFRAIVDEAAVSKMLEPLDRVNGELDRLAGRHSHLRLRCRLSRLSRETVRRGVVWAVGNGHGWTRAFHSVAYVQEGVRESLGALWRDYERSLTNQASSDEARAGTSTGNQKARRLTHHGFEINGPRFDKSPCVGCPADIIYSVRTPEEFPALYRLSSERIAPATFGQPLPGINECHWRRSDLFRSARTSTERRSHTRPVCPQPQDRSRHTLTSEARLLDPDLGPDGRTLAAVQDAQPGQRNLVLVDLHDLGVTTISSEPETQFNTPRWSPDGRAIVVERHILGRQSEIAIVDVATRDVRTIASRAGTRFVTPTWRPDGRAIIAAADASEGPFELCRDSSRQRRRSTFLIAG